MKRFFWLSLYPICFVLSCSQENGVLISNVHDGDTFTDAQKNRYRLFGVDTPEISDQYHGFKTTSGIEYIYALEAQKYVESIILNKEVKINFVTNDKYKRRVVRINTNIGDLGIKLLQKGLARIAYISLDHRSPYYTNDYDYYYDLMLAQYIAWKNKVGIWRHEERMKEIFPKS